MLKLFNPTHSLFSEATTMKLQDLEMTQDLSHDERAVRGGSANFGYIGGPVLATSGGASLFSPSTNVQIFEPVQTQTNVDPTTITSEVSKSANVLGSLGTLIAQ
jgi:hypothetical protein